MSCFVDNIINVNSEMMEKAYDIISEEIKHNMHSHPNWKVITCAYLMGLDHGYAAHKEKANDE